MGSLMMRLGDTNNVTCRGEQRAISSQEQDGQIKRGVTAGIRWGGDLCCLFFYLKILIYVNFKIKCLSKELLQIRPND